jgi:hypothetical protein
MSKLIGYNRKETLVIVYIQKNENVFSDWFFACNTDTEILEHLKNENVDVSLFEN